MATTTAAGRASTEEQIVRMGRMALATQGVLYVVVGFLAAQLARGDGDSEASQTGAIESIARQPFGTALLVLVAIGLVAHAAWRIVLAVRGEPGDDDDSKSVAKRAANVGRAAIYVSFTFVAIRILTSDRPAEGGGSGGSGSGGSTEQESTAAVLSWPGGPWIVMAAGVAVLGVAVWNARKAVTRSFTDDLDLSSLDHQKRRTVEWLGTGGYLARGGAFALIGWFLITAGREHDAGETRGLDASLRELAATGYGPILLLLLAVGLVLFGAFRILDAVLRRPSELTHS